MVLLSPGPPIPGSSWSSGSWMRRTQLSCLRKLTLKTIVPLPCLQKSVVQEVRPSSISFCLPQPHAALIILKTVQSYEKSIVPSPCSKYLLPRARFAAGKLEPCDHSVCKWGPSPPLPLRFNWKPCKQVWCFHLAWFFGQQGCSCNRCVKTAHNPIIVLANPGTVFEAVKAGLKEHDPVVLYANTTNSKPKRRSWPGLQELFARGSSENLQGAYPNRPAGIDSAALVHEGYDHLSHGIW